MNKEDVYADLMYAYNELIRQPSDITDVTSHEVEFIRRFPNSIVPYSSIYWRAESRAKIRTAHEAIEKGLKAILLDSGLTKVRKGRDGHELHLLLMDVQQHNSMAFNELERCFDGTIRYLESVTSLKHNTDIVSYFQANFRAGVFVEARYSSIDGPTGNHGSGMIFCISFEMILVLVSLIAGFTYQDIGSRIEEEVKEAIIIKSKLDPKWDTDSWLSKGPVLARLEILEDLRDNKVLRAAVRRCANLSKDPRVKFWAERRIRELALERKARIQN